MHLFLAALQWDPHIRGGLILLTAFTILCGSVYMLLATNSGARLGFLLAVAGLSGWMLIMGVVWMVFGIGLKGRDPEWKPKELITGSLEGRATVEKMREFPNGWKKLETGNATLADAQSAADRVFAPPTSGGGGHGEESEGMSPEEQARFQSPFSSVDDYLPVAGYEVGGDNELFTIGTHDFFFRHSPHYAVIQVKPVIPDCKANQTSTTAEPCRPPLPEGSPPRTAVINEDAPVTTLIMVRDLGNVRLPPFLISIFSLIVFGVTCSVLHERDKEIMRARGQIPVTA